MPACDSPPIQAVLFDVDGTLVDSFPALIPGLADTYEHFLGIRPANQAIRAMMGIPLRVQMGFYQEPKPDEATLQSMIDYTLERYDFYADRERTFDAAVDALRLLHEAGIKTALVTSKNDVELASFLKRFSARDAVDATVCVSDVVHPKPHAESAILACSRLGVSPDRTAFVGDSVFDLKCARSAKVAVTIAVTYGGGTETALRAEHPDRIFPTPEALRMWAQNQVATLCADARP